MKKHRFNIFPEAKAEDYKRLRDDIKANGFDRSQPITLYQGEILDGWNRHRACTELGIQGHHIEIHGTDNEAVAFVMRTNKRRNLNSGQWACIAAEADDLIAAIAEAQPKGGRPKADDKPAQKIALVSKDERSTNHKLAESFNTNRTYVNQAAKMKEQAPDVFEKVKDGKMTMQDANKAVRAIPTDPWLDDEKERKAKVESGVAVVANQQRDKNLIQWAEQNGKAVRVDRGTLFGNPFVLGADGDRDAVCDAYANHHMPHKPSIIKALPSLKGKVLICHCYPERCHAEALIRPTMANDHRGPQPAADAAQPAPSVPTPGWEDATIPNHEDEQPAPIWFLNKAETIKALDRWPGTKISKERVFQLFALFKLLTRDEKEMFAAELNKSWEIANRKR